MIAVISLPLVVTILLRGLPGVWQPRHRLALAPRAEGCLLECPSLGAWWVADALQTLPPPQDGTPPLVGDGSVKPKRGTQHPLAHTGRKSAPQPWLFGIRFALVIATWAISRLPMALRVLRRKTDPA